MRPGLRRGPLLLPHFPATCSQRRKPKSGTSNLLAGRARDKIKSQKGQLIHRVEETKVHTSSEQENSEQVPIPPQLVCKFNT